MTDLVAFITARLAEVEAAATTAARADGKFGGRANWSARYGGIVTSAEDPDWGVVDLSPLIEDGDLGTHIALHDPARELREVEAKRERLALYLDARETLAAALKAAPPEDDPATAHSYVRERINVNQASGRFGALEMSVRLDAAVWSDHPDYDPAGTRTTT